MNAASLKPNLTLSNPIQATFHTPVGVTVSGPAAHFLGSLMMKVLGASEDSIKKASEAKAKSEASGVKTKVEIHIVKTVKTTDEPKAETDGEKKTDAGAEPQSKVKTEPVWREVNFNSMMLLCAMGEVANDFKRAVFEMRAKTKQAAAENTASVSVSAAAK